VAAVPRNGAVHGIAIMEAIILDTKFPTNNRFDSTFNCTEGDSDIIPKE
jgi:hypothetical protein